jgi:hypothetical protein
LAQDAAKEKEIARQMMQTNKCPRCRKMYKEGTRNPQSLRDELEASQALVAQLLQKSNTSTNGAFVVEKNQ